MHLFLIRHAETEHNIAGLLAGSTNSRLTTHGQTQTALLATHLVHTRALQFTHIVTSDLDRARLTGGAIAAAAAKSPTATTTTTTTTSEAGIEVWTDARLQEQSFGEHELQPWSAVKAERTASSTSPSKTSGRHSSSKIDSEGEIPPPPPPEENDADVQIRVRAFVQGVLVPMLQKERDGAQSSVVALVSHGLTLRHIWAEILRAVGGVEQLELALTEDRASGDRTTTPKGNAKGKRDPEREEQRRARAKQGSVPIWSNTGFVEVEVRPLLLPAASAGCAEDTSTREETASVDAVLPPPEEAARVDNDAETLAPPALGESARPPTPPPALASPAETATTTTAAAASTQPTPPAPVSTTTPTSPPAPAPFKAHITLLALNSTSHLSTLKRTRGGVGSAVWDGRQRTLDSMFNGNGEGRGRESKDGERTGRESAGGEKGGKRVKM